ncbi:CRISPR-associated endoribonuclease Cas2 [Mycobacterium heckeshornense]|uniref:CRISPR-associated endonuclease Cas2 n=1 Tax=Mycobacterium heckeshornense TaxID=110505 RepID=UPI001945A0B3|nr:CRISPR-associated endonuclease Cas2 [Mycobacterium heckeshornense]BCQ10561.1 CRISPR-associated endoribonuclease Cas2 [Mycobacterium heckeshornense]
MPQASREEYFNLPLDVDESSGALMKAFVLVIYDIADNKRRTFLAKTLSGFGYRVQESAFEAVLTKAQLTRLMTRVERFSKEGDNIRIYKIRGDAAVTFYGEGRLISAEDIEFI